MGPDQTRPALAISSWRVSAGPVLSTVWALSYITSRMFLSSGECGARTDYNNCTANCLYTVSDLLHKQTGSLTHNRVTVVVAVDFYISYLVSLP